MASSLQINNARLLDPANNLDQQDSLYVSNCMIVGIGTTPTNFHADTTIDA